jgi:non-heme chloroperoxidase
MAIALRALLRYLLLSPLIYLLIAATLVLLPVTRETVENSLEFDSLELAEENTTLWQEHFFVARDSRELFYRQLTGEGSTVIVLLHGSGSEGRYLAALASGLHQTLNATVVVPDLRGHGRSMGDMPGDITYLGQFDDDLSDLYALLSAQQPKALMVLAGHSSGGGLALRYGAMAASQFDAYLLLAPYLGHQSPTVRPDSGGWVQVSIRRYAGLSMLNNVGISGLNGTPVLFFNRPPQWRDASQLNSYSYRLNQSFAPRNYRTDLPAIAKPLMVVVGENDEAFYAAEFAPLLSEYAPDSQFLLIPGTDHLGLVGSEALVPAIGNWLP